MKKLKHDQLKKVCDNSDFAFKTTEDYSFEREAVHQHRAISSLEFGLNMHGNGYNIYVSGYPGTGRNTQVNDLVNKIAATQELPADWLYLHNFVNEDEPVAVRLPAGKGIMFKKDVEELIEDLQDAVPKAFESEDYEQRRSDLLHEYKNSRDRALEEIEDKAHEEGFVLKQTATGAILVPRKGDKPMSGEDYDALSEEKKSKMEKKKDQLHIEIERVLADVRAMEKKAKDKINELEKDVALFSVKHIIDELRYKYRDSKDVIAHLNYVQEDVISNLHIFKEEVATGAQQIVFGLRGKTPSKDPFLKYRVNLLVDHRNSHGAPVVREQNPTYYNLIGRIEYATHMGAMSTDFTMIAPGALHKANGGYLILQAMDVFKSFMAWDTIKRVIRDREVKVEDINEQFRLVTTSSLKPRPIPSDLKIIMIGPPWLYQLLYRFDEEFRKLFKIRCDFDTEMDRDDEMIGKYTAFIKVRCEDEGLRHFKSGAVARVVEYGSRLSGDKEKLSARFMDIADILREADFWAGKEQAEYVSADHVDKAVKEKIYRSNLVESKTLELIEKGVIFIDVSKKVVGQLNALAVSDIGGYMFGKPSRITARTYMGKAGVVDIERQVKMGGNIHSKGVMILNGYLGEKFAQSYPLTLSASICFEQSYGGVDGDSASSSEAYCLLSALSGVPVKQCIAVTGSMNQHGDVQPVGGINQKIEGFYHACKLKGGLNGEQGVIIPTANVRHLMLNGEVVEAVKKGKFNIWAVSSIDEGIEILTGKKAGKRNSSGVFPKGTINRLVEDKLRRYAAEHPQSNKLFGKAKNKKKKGKG